MDKKLNDGNSIATREKNSHPSKNLRVRSRGYGVAAGYEKPYRKEDSREVEKEIEIYGPIPHSGYYGTGSGLRPFKTGEASFNEEVDWYGSQYGETTSGFDEVKRKR
jgi:hypothetical protein